jgi:twitching motility protein PilJ
MSTSRTHALTRDCLGSIAMCKSFRALKNMNMWLKSSVILLLMFIPTVSFLYLQQGVSVALLLVLVGVPSALAVAVALSVNRQMTRQLKAITRLFDQVGIGDYAARAEVLSEDELGSMANALNYMLDNTLTLIPSQEECDAMQAATRKLQEEVAELHQLRAIVARMQEAALQVGASAHEMQAEAEYLAQGSTAQTAHIMDNLVAMDAMALAIQRVSDHTALSAQVAEQALAQTRKGARAVQNTIEALDRTRAEVEETVARITTLGERSVEVSTIVQLMGDIADRTSVLALNAAIEAALAGEAGQGLVVVAADVERLAQRAADATRQAGGLLQTIQTEMHKAVTAIAASTREVGQGVQVANQAGQALGEVERVSVRLADLIQSSALVAQQQARDSESLSQAMREMTEVTQQTAAGTRQTAVSMSNLATLAGELQASVSIFQLPAHTNGHQEVA